MKRIYIIAEVGVNHNGSLKMAKELIDVAVGARADAVKFQTFNADRLVSAGAPKADYQKKATDSHESQYEMLKRLEFTTKDYQKLHEYCREKRIDFLSTPFDSESLYMLIENFCMPYIKVASGEITNAPFLLEVARTGKPVILSTGMCTLADIENALKVLAFGYKNKNTHPDWQLFEEVYSSSEGQALIRDKIILLHCTTEYPAPFDEVNLMAMDTLASAFGVRVGYSDHTEGIAVPLAAAARGAVVIEKHFTLDRNLPGPDHRASLEPSELAAMVKGIRQIEAAVGHGLKLPTASEMRNKFVARKSLVANAEIKKGEIFTEENLAVKRPGSGISPMYYWDYIGKVAERDYERDETI